MQGQDNQFSQNKIYIQSTEVLLYKKNKNQMYNHTKIGKFKRLDYYNQKLLHNNPVMEYQRKINKNILIIYTSGSVGANQKLQIHKDFLRQKMMTNSYLCDIQFTMENFNSQKLITPILQNGYRVEYQIFTMSHIQSSINSTITESISIAKIIEQKYDQYDAFIIITGFDLMCYISTTLSFMLQNLGKPVIFTGGHLPISYVRNDFINNIIQSFSIISLAKNLNDVLIVCKNKGFRANRCQKLKQSQMDTIKSPNMHSIVSIDIKLRFKFNLFLPLPTQQFKVFCGLSEKVHVIKFHLYMNKQTLRYELQNPNIIGYVIESYTAANLPQNSEILQIFKQASQKYGKVFVNISQNVYKEKRSIMKEFLEKYHIHFGGDMTLQAALAKLSYLIGKRYIKEQLTRKISINLRGQMTQIKNQNQFQIQAQGFMQAVQNVLEQYYPTSTQFDFTLILEDEIGKYVSSQLSPTQFKIIFKNYKNKQQIISITEIINRNLLLHEAVIQHNYQLISYFLSLPIQKNLLDQHKHSAFFYAIKSFNKAIIHLLYKKNCHVICPNDDLIDIFIQQIKKDNHTFFELLYHIQFKTTLCDIFNSQKRNVAHLAAFFGAQKCLEIFFTKFKFQLNQKDIYEQTVQDYIQMSKKKYKSKSSVSTF